MIIGIKDLAKLFAITVVVCCAVFVCSLFLNYNLDLTGIQDKITTETGRILYDAQLASGQVVASVSGGCLVVTTVIMLVFYVKNYIDSHGKELGILKALGYSRLRVARHFWVFGISAGIGSVLGCAGAWLYMPAFYEMQNAEGLFPELDPQFHPALSLALLALPTAFFMLLAVCSAFFKMKRPVIGLLKEAQEVRIPASRKEKEELPFLADLRRSTLRSRKTLVFFIGFSAFCFSSMTQMSLSMEGLGSEAFSWMILSIGLILAFMTLFMSLTSVVKANTKTIAMMKVFGYSRKDYSGAILGGYRPVAGIGFAIGTVYQYVLLRIAVDLIFADFEKVPEYQFSFSAFLLSLGMFILAYELTLYYYSWKISRQPTKSVMLE